MNINNKTTTYNKCTVTVSPFGAAAAAAVGAASLSWSSKHYSAVHRNGESKKKKLMIYYRGSHTFDSFAPHIIHNSIKFVNLIMWNILLFVILACNSSFLNILRMTTVDLLLLLLLFLTIFFSLLSFSLGFSLVQIHIFLLLSVRVLSYHHPINAAQFK